MYLSASAGVSKLRLMRPSGATVGSAAALMPKPSPINRVSRPISFFISLEDSPKRPTTLWRIHYRCRWPSESHNLYYVNFVGGIEAIVGADGKAAAQLLQQLRGSGNASRVSTRPRSAWSSRAAGGRVDACRGQRNVADALADRVGNRVRQRRAGRSLRRLARSQERRTRMRDHLHVDRFRHVREARDGISAPVAAGDAMRLPRDLLEKRPADGLHDAALDLVADAVGI